VCNKTTVKKPRKRGLQCSRIRSPPTPLTKKRSGREKRIRGGGKQLWRVWPPIHRSNERLFQGDGIKNTLFSPEGKDLLMRCGWSIAWGGWAASSKIKRGELDRNCPTRKGQWETPTLEVSWRGLARLRLGRSECQGRLVGKKSKTKKNKRRKMLCFVLSCLFFHIKNSHFGFRKKKSRVTNASWRITTAYIRG